MKYVLVFAGIAVALFFLGALARGLLSAARRILGLLALLITPIVIATLVDYDRVDGLWVGVLLVIIALSPLGRALGRAWQDTAPNDRGSSCTVAAPSAEPHKIPDAPSRGSTPGPSIGSRLSSWVRPNSRDTVKDQYARLDAAWEVLAALAPRAAARIAVARRSCEEFLRLDPAATLSTETIEMRVTIIDNVPRAINEFARHSSLANGSPDPASLGNLLRTIERVAARAEQLLTGVEEQSRGELELIRRHIDSKLASDPFSTT